MRRGGLQDHSSKQTHRWMHERSCVRLLRSCVPDVRSPGSAERGLPHNPCEGGGLGTRSPTANLSQNTDTGDHRLRKVFPDKGLIDDSPALYSVDIFLQN